MPACGYEVYLRVFKSISHTFAALTREISSCTLEDKIHMTSGHVISSMFMKTLMYEFLWLILQFDWLIEFS